MKGYGMNGRRLFDIKLAGTFFSRKFFSALKVGVLGNFLSSFYGVIDLMFAGMLIGPSAVGAVELLFPVKQLGSFVSCLFLIGTPIVYGEEIGKFDKKSADGTLSLGGACSLGISILYVCAALLLKEQFLGYYDLTDEVYELSATYYNYIAIDMILRPAGAFMYYMLMLDGDNKTASISLVAQFLSRIVLSALLIPLMGIAGLGLAAVISVALMMAICTTHFFRKNNTIHLGKDISLKKIPRIIRFSTVDAVDFVLSALFTLYLNTSMTVKFGVDGLLLASAVTLIYQLFMGLDGVGIAMEVMVNVYRGEKSHEGVKNILIIGFKWSVILGTIMAAAMFLFAEGITEYLGITDYNMATVVTWGIRLTCVSAIIVSVSYCLTSFYLYVERIGLGFITTIIEKLLPIAGIELFAVLYDKPGIFVGVLISTVLSLAISLLYAYFRYGKTVFPYTIDRAGDILDDRLFEYELKKEQVIELLESAESYLINMNCSKKAIHDVRLVLEESLFYTIEINADTKGKPVCGECAVILGNEITLVLRDDGVVTDLTDSDRSLTSFRSYILGHVVEKKTANRHNLITNGSNRCSFSIPEAMNNTAMKPAATEEDT